MTKKTSRKPARKAPLQSRSKVTVDVILEAAIRILESEGSLAMTTSRVAEVAGVSVGTLYQYFGNRDAILDALQDRELERATELLQSLLQRGAPLSDRDLARRVVEGLMQLYQAAPALHRVLAVEGLRVSPKERVLAFDLRLVTAIRSFLSLSKAPLRRTNLDAAAFVIYQSVRASMLAYLLERPAGVDERALTEELIDLTVTYLLGPTDS
jgi:AcrR family transcriptional regulator